MDRKVIDFAALEENMRAIDDVFKENNLGTIEQSLILAQMQARINKRVEEAKAKDMLGNMPMMDIVKGMLKQRDKDEG